MSSKKNEPTISQKKAINIDINAVVSAGAGSGKTSVLSQRFVHLVTDRKYKVEEILTLTFTKKATVEMYGRIYKELKEKSPESVKDFYKANIKTLDSYCASIAKQGCHFYGISPDFTEDEDSIRETANNMALPFILEHRDNPAIKELVQTKNYADIAEELFVNPIIEESSIAEPIDFDECNARQKNEVIDAWNKNALKVQDILHSLDSALDNYEGKRNGVFITNLTNALSAERPELPILTEDIIENSDSADMEKYLTVVHSITSLKLNTPNGCDEIKELIVALREYFAILASLLNYVSGYKITKAITPLLKEFQDKVIYKKRSTATLSYKDVASLAKCILRDYPEIRQLEKQKYKAIMIDEFQDNNEMQKDLLFMVAEKLGRTEKGIPNVSELCPDKLFFVGDEKQSIYRFRGADVSVFRGLSKDFESGNLELKENFRSDKPLVSAFNTIFGGFSYPDNKEQNQPSVFYNDASNPSDIPEYEAVYHKVDYPESKDKGDSDKHIHIALYDENQEAEETMLAGEEAEALWVAKKIASLLQECKYKPSDIAILFRSYALQPLYERMLLQEGIPYNCEVATGFFNDGPTNDIFSMLRLCAYKTDSLSYATVLHSPFANLTTDEANAIIAKDKEPFAAQAEDILGDSSFKRYSHAKAVYEELCARAMTEPLTELISYLWYEAGYRYETLWNESVSMYASLYDRMFELARQAEEKTMSLAAFVDSVRTFHDEKEKLNNMDIPLEHEDSIHILTIHKSKGLEYPVVFLCGTHKTGKNDTNSSPVYCSREYGITINTPASQSFFGSKENYFYSKVKAINTAMECAELKRVTYVALTRAEKELYITGKVELEENNIKQTEKQSTNPRCILSILAPVYNYYAEDISSSKSPFTFECIPPMERTAKNIDGNKRENTPSARMAFINNAGQLYSKADIIQADVPESIYINPSSLKTGEGEKYNEKAPYKEIKEIVDQSNGKFGLNDFGSIAHFYLEQTVNGTNDNIPSKFLLGLENNKTAIDTVLNTAKKMANDFMQSELGKQALQAEWKKAEYAFRSRIDDKIVKGTMDLVFRTAEGNYIVVDYKTDSDINPKEHYPQLACYRQAVSQMLGCPEKDIKCYLYYLRYNKAVDISQGL